MKKRSLCECNQEQNIVSEEVMLKMLEQHYIWKAMIGTNVYEII
jgi:hypothetical protein